MKPISLRLAASILALAALLCPVSPSVAAEGPGKVNLNTATVEQLSYLPRIGAVVAQRILEYREQNGKFKSPDELMLVRGIGEKTFELLEPYLSVSGETTLTEKVSAPSAEKGKG